MLEQQYHFFTAKTNNEGYMTGFVVLRPNFVSQVPTNA